MKVPFQDLQPQNESIKTELEGAFKTVLRSNNFILGENVTAFEREYATFNQTREAVGVSSGLDALILSLKALGIGAGDEVIVPSNTYIATALAVSHVGAKPVLVEPRKDTFNLDSNRMEAAITGRTKAIIPVHLCGQACEMNAISAIAIKHNLFMVEDNAQAQGSRFDGRPTGSWGHINATSFYPTKNLGAMGDAGAITTDDRELAEKVRSLRSYGSPQKNVHEQIGFNARMDEMQAAMLRIKLRQLDEWNKQRQQAASFYHSELIQTGDLMLPFVLPNATHVYHLFVIRTHRRDELKQFLVDKGIETAIHYPTPLHLQPAYTELNLAKGSFPIAEELAETSLSLPLFPGMTEEQQQAVVAAIKAFFHA